MPPAVDTRPKLTAKLDTPNICIDEPALSKNVSVALSLSRAVEAKHGAVLISKSGGTTMDPPVQFPLKVVHKKVTQVGDLKPTNVPPRFKSPGESMSLVLYGKEGPQKLEVPGKLSVSKHADPSLEATNGKDKIKKIEVDLAKPDFPSLIINITFACPITAKEAWLKLETEDTKKNKLKLEVLLTSPLAGEEVGSVDLKKAKIKTPAHVNDSVAKVFADWIKANGEKELEITVTMSKDTIDPVGQFADGTTTFKIVKKP